MMMRLGAGALNVGRRAVLQRSAPAVAMRLVPAAALTTSPTAAPRMGAAAGEDALVPDSAVFGTPAISSEPQVEPYTFPGIAQARFPDDVATVLLAPIDAFDVEIKPDGLLYLPEIKYRRILNKAFGPGAWALMPRSQHHLQGDTLSREYALFVYGRYVSQARGEQQVFEKAGVATASEGVKSNALMRCCKDIGIASELWDPIFIARWKAKYAVERWVEHARTKSKTRMWRRTDRKFDYPYAERDTTAPA
jgi:hypothetical protein